MVWTFVTGDFLNPYEVMTGFIGGPGVYKVLIIVDRPETDIAQLYAGIRPFSRINPNVSGIGLTSWFHNYSPMYRVSELRVVEFYGGGFVEVQCLPGPFTFPVRYRILQEPL